MEEGTHSELLERQGAYHMLVQMQQAEGDAGGQAEDDEEASRRAEEESHVTVGWLGPHVGASEVQGAAGATCVWP